MPRLSVLGSFFLHPPVGADPLKRVKNAVTGEYSIPVFSFGDPTNALIATISINPSDKEFLNRQGNPLHLLNARFTHPWVSPGAAPKPNLTSLVNAIQSDCNNYFKRNTYYKSWFNPMQQLLTHPNTKTKGLSYFNGSVCHLDLSPWASKPVWRRLTAAEQQAHITNGTPILLDQLGFSGGCIHQSERSSNIHTILLNGKTTVNTVLHALSPGLKPKFVPVPGISGLKIATGSVLGINYVGWNLYLQRSGNWITQHIAPYI